MENEEKVKSFLEGIVGAELSLKAIKKTEDDVKRELFESIINTYELANNRTMLLEKDHGLSNYEYDKSFHQIIDGLLVMHFGEDITDLILWYIYDRVNPENGKIEQLTDESGKPVPLENATDLWVVVQRAQAAATLAKTKGKKGGR